MSKLTKTIIVTIAIYLALIAWAQVSNFCPIYIDKMPRIYSEGLKGKWEKLTKRGNYNLIHKLLLCTYPEEVVY